MSANYRMIEDEGLLNQPGDIHRHIAGIQLRLKHSLAQQMELTKVVSVFHDNEVLRVFQRNQ